MAGESSSRATVWAGIAAITCAHLASLFMEIKAYLVREAGVDPNTVAAAARTDAGPAHSGGQTVKSKGGTKTEKVKRELTDYQKFMKEQGPLIKAQNPTLSPREVQQEALKAWGVTKEGKSGHGEQAEANLVPSVPTEAVGAAEQVPAVVPTKGEEKKKKKKRPSVEDFENTPAHKSQEVEDAVDHKQLVKREKKKKKIDEA